MKKIFLLISLTIMLFGCNSSEYKYRVVYNTGKIDTLIIHEDNPKLSSGIFTSTCSCEEYARDVKSFTALGLVVPVVQPKTIKDVPKTKEESNMSSTIFTILLVLLIDIAILIWLKLLKVKSAATKYEEQLRNYKNQNTKKKI